MPRSSNRPLSRRKKLVFSALVLLAFVVTAELVARVSGFGAAPPGVAQFKRASRQLADWKFKWESDFYVVDPASHIPGINFDGVRDRKRPLENLQGATRIACLGDSVTYGYGVPAQYAYPGILESALRDAGQNVEVFNIALFGWSTRQERIAYHRIARKYRPHFVILGVCLNDVVETRNNNVKPPRYLTQLYRHSHLFRAMMRPHAAEIHRVEELFEDPEAPRVKEGWRLCLEEIEGLAQEVEQDGARLILLSFPFRFQVEPSAPEPIPQRVLAQFCRDRGLPFIDALPTLKPLLGFGFIDYDHLSPNGAVAVAQTIVASGHLDADTTPGSAVAPGSF